MFYEFNNTENQSKMLYLKNNFTSDCQTSHYIPQLQLIKMCAKQHILKFARNIKLNKQIGKTKHSQIQISKINYTNLSCGNPIILKYKYLANT